MKQYHNYLILKGDMCMTINNTGSIYTVLEKAGDYLRTDIKNLSDLSSMLVSEVINLDTKSINKNNIEKNDEILHEIQSMAKSVSEIDKWYSKDNISENCEVDIIIRLLQILKTYGMLDISYGSKGKITIDLKHCQEIEKL